MEDQRSSCKTGVVSRFVSYLVAAVIVVTRSCSVNARSTSADGVEPREYCQTEHFNATCPRDHVIIIISARYGRMRAGRCVTGSYGFMGCSADVFSFIDRKCSGHAQCRLHTMDQGLHQSEPCPKDLAAYLEVAYICIAVVTGSRQTCKTLGYTPLVGNSGYLSSNSVTSSSELGYGTKECPWRIQVASGQRVRITQVAFGGLRPIDNSGDIKDVSSPSPDVCYEIGVATEESTATSGGHGGRGSSSVGSGASSPLKACTTSDRTELGRVGGAAGGIMGNVSTVAALMYLSRGSSVMVRFHAKQVLQELTPFLLNYEAEGCQTLATPAGGWIRNEDDRLLLGCNNLKEIWHLKCVGNSWTGPMPNCTVPASTWTQNRPAQPDEEAFPLGILLVVAIGVALGVFLGGALLSVVSLVLKRRNRLRQPSQSALTSSNVIQTNGDHYGGDSTMTTTYPRHVMHCAYHTTTAAGLDSPGPGTTKTHNHVMYGVETSPARHEHQYQTTDDMSATKFVCHDEHTNDILYDRRCMAKNAVMLHQNVLQLQN